MRVAILAFTVAACGSDPEGQTPLDGAASADVLPY